MKQKRSKKATAGDLSPIAELLDQIDPDLSYGDWLRVLMGIYHETGGSEDGFELADAWCSRGRKYGGAREIRYKWDSFSPNQDPPVTIGTLIWMARQKP